MIFFLNNGTEKYTMISEHDSGPGANEVLKGEIY